MNILALETSGQHGSVATLVGQQLRCEGSWQGQRTAQLLAPTIREILNQSGWRPQEIQLIGLTRGPGSFTGLRIGVTTAKTLAYALGCQLVALNTLAVIASQAAGLGGPLWVVMDAQRQQLFAARLEPSQDPLLACQPLLLDNRDWLDRLEPGAAVSGPALGKLQEQLPEGIRVPPQADWYPRAASVGQLALRAFQAGRRDDFWRLTPDYYRPSAAEEKGPIGGPEFRATEI